MISLLRPALSLLLLLGLTPAQSPKVSVTELRDTALNGETLEAQGQAVLELVWPLVFSMVR